MRKRGMSFLCVGLILSMCLAACSPAAEEPETMAAGTEMVVTETAAATEGAETAAGQATARAEARGFGGIVSVTLTVDEDRVVDAVIEGTDETPDVGGRAVEQMARAMKETGSVDVDGVSGATVSSTAILTAARQAYMEATGQQLLAEVKMKPGTYTGEATGFRSGHTIPVEVTVDETSILDIVIDRSQVADTIGVFESAQELLIPRILENQSVAVDAITGATSSSNGIKLAVADALRQALEAGGSDAAGIDAFQTMPPKASVTEELNVGVLVVGMGGAGTAAAVRAAEVMYEQDPEQVSVLAIDKAGHYGGMASLTMSIFALNPARFCAEYNGGEEYCDREELLTDWLAYCRGDAKEESVVEFLDTCGDVFDWMVYEHGLEMMEPTVGLSAADTRLVCFNFANTDKGLTVRRQGTLDFYDRMIAGYEEMGGQYMLETTGYELLYDEASQAVTGCKARGDNGVEYVIHADAVIIATGGFGGNAEMEEEYLSNEFYPLKGAWKQEGMQQNEGEMIEAALRIGAGTYNIDMCPMVHMSGSDGFLTQFEYHDTGVYNSQTNLTTIWTEGDLPMFMGLQPNTLAVNTEGRRFAAETGVAMLDPWKAGPKFYSIYSEEMVDRILEDGFAYPTAGVAANNLGACGAIPDAMPMDKVYEVLDAGIEAGFVVKAQTLEELAQLLDMDPETLAGTVASYNNMCEAGEDTEFGKPAEYLEQISTNGGFYAIRMASYCYGTCGALDVNTDYEVLQADGETAIHGLYATGQDSMGVLFTNQDAYVTYGGVAEGFAYTSGYQAGENAAKLALVQ